MSNAPAIAAPRPAVAGAGARAAVARPQPAWAQAAGQSSLFSARRRPAAGAGAGRARRAFGRAACWRRTAAACRHRNAARPAPSAVPMVPAGQGGARARRALRQGRAASAAASLAGLCRQARRRRRIPPVKEDKSPAPTLVLPAGGYIVHVGFGLATAVKPVTLQRGDRARGVRSAGRRLAHRRPRRRRAHSGRANFLRHLQGQPVRARRPAADRRARDDRRRRGGAGRHLLHRVELRRRQFGGALRHPRAGRQAHRHHRHPSRRRDHAQAGEREGRRGARQHRLVGAYARAAT